MVFIILAISANVFQTTLRTFGPARYTDRPAMQDEAMAQVISLFRRYDLPEFPLYFGGLLDAVHQADQVAQTDAVSIRDNSRFAKHVSHDQICALSAHTGESQQLIEGFRYIVIVFLMQDLHAGGNVPRFAGSQPAGPHDLFDLPYLRFCQRRD